MTCFTPARRFFHGALAACLLVSLSGRAGLPGSAHARAAAPPPPSLEEGERLFTSGQLEDAFEIWEATAAKARKAGLPLAEFDALLRQAAACQETGRQRLALELLAKAELLLPAGGDALRRVQLLGLRGTVCAFSRQSAEAESLLQEAAREALHLGEVATAARARSNLGILHASAGRMPEARQALELAAALAARAEDSLLQAGVEIHRLEAALIERDAKAARTARAGMERAFTKLNDAPGSISLLLSGAHLCQQLFALESGADKQLLLRAFSLDRLAENQALATGNQRALAQARGHLGFLYEMEGRHEEALALTRRALALAQKLRLPELTCRLQWQLGRILAARGEADAAIASYKAAAAGLQPLRTDIAIRMGNLNAGSSLREAVGGLYFELADLLLRKAEGIEAQPAGQALLAEARETLEQLKAAELNDYFQEDCVPQMRSKPRRIDTLAHDAAVLYFLPLSDRLEILLGSPGAPLVRVTTPVGRAELEKTVRAFRRHLEDRTTEEYLAEAGILYGWTLRPLEGVLKERSIKTLVFVPDGALRTVPMAALHDGNTFLVERFAVAVAPGLELTTDSPGEATQRPPTAFLAGLSEARQGFPPLPQVAGELRNLARIFGAGVPVMNRDFVSGPVSRTIAGEPFTVVHLATHGHIDRDVTKSFVLTYDTRLTLDDLERSIRPAQLRNQPLELLVLSACQTAAGDDRAALGLGGVAVKAGARSAFATLWYVNDEASSLVVGEFYRLWLGAAGQRLEKAAALQGAQRKLLADGKYVHPCYWAPYLLIGNWQ